MEASSIKDKIITESIALFLNYGIKSVTMDDIAKHLGMSKKTIYQHFKDKEEMIILATDQYFKNEHERMDGIEAGSENAVEALHNLTICLREQLKNAKANVLFDLKKYYVNAWNKYKRFKRDVIYESVINNLKRGITEGLYRSDLNVEILAQLRIGEIEMSFNWEYFPDDKFTLVDVHEQLLKHFTYGILSEKGFKLFENYKLKEA